MLEYTQIFPCQMNMRLMGRTKQTGEPNRHEQPCFDVCDRTIPEDVYKQACISTTKEADQGLLGRRWESHCTTTRKCRPPSLELPYGVGRPEAWWRL
jgi:hypothetical protein